MAESAERVCPRCGHEADGHAFCPECGLDLKAQGALPTRAEWIRSRQQPAATATPPAAERAPAEPPSPGGGTVSESPVLPVVLIVLGLALAVFGIVRIAGGDSEVGKLEDQRDSLKAEQETLTADQSAIEKDGQETEGALGDFIEGAETVGERWEAAVAANNRVVTALTSGGGPSGSELQEGSAANAALRKSVDQAERLLGELREPLAELEESISAAER